MKKCFLFLSVFALALVSCKEDPAPDVLELISVTPAAETIIPRTGTDDPIVIVFKATQAWTASLEGDGGTITPKSGEAAEECKVKFNVDENTEEANRIYKITLSEPGVTPVTLEFTQDGIAHMNITPAEFSVPVGGSKDFVVELDANVQYSISTYDDTFTWQHVGTLEGGKLPVTIDANPGYDARESYIKFTTSELQDPVLDEEGNPTGETKDRVIRVYFKQAGHASIEWRTEFTWDLSVGEGLYKSYTAALVGDNLIVSTGQGVWPFSTKNGAMGSKLSLEQTPYGVANDDAGNVVAFIGGTYDLSGAGNVIPLNVCKVNPTDFSLTPIVKNVVNAFYGYGFDSMNVTGDVTKEAAIAFASGCGTGYAVLWQVTGGAVEANSENPSSSVSYSAYVPYPSVCANVWSSRQCVARCVTSKIDGGLQYMGYDNVYNLFYNPGLTAEGWSEVYVSGSSWMEGYSGMDAIEWNGHKYLAVVKMSYYPQWGPSALLLFNNDDPAAPKLVSNLTFGQAEGQFCYGANTDVCLAVESGSLVAYVVEPSIAAVMKIKYPAL